MIKKNPLLATIVILVLGYFLYTVVNFYLSQSRITYDDKEPQIKLSQLIDIPEIRTKYSTSFYIDKEFIGFNAFVDKQYFVSVTKLGRISGAYRMIKTNKRPPESTSIIGIPPSVEDFNSRYYNINRHPFKINKNIYYYIENGSVININQYKFLEIEATFSALNVSFEGEDSKDFGYVGLKRKKSISFIKYKDNLYVLSLSPMAHTRYTSLHDLSHVYNVLD